jgi:hypothetical protein
MSASKGYAVFLQPTAPAQFFGMLKDFVMTADPVSFLLSSTFEESIHFVKLTLMRKGQKTPWHLRIPVTYILAIAEIENIESPLGFV